MRSLPRISSACLGPLGGGVRLPAGGEHVMDRRGVRVLNRALGRVAALEVQLQALGKVLEDLDPGVAEQVAREIATARIALPKDLAEGYHRSMDAFHGAMGVERGSGNDPDEEED